MKPAQPFSLRFVGDTAAARATARSAPSWFAEVPTGGTVVWVDSAAWAGDCAHALADGARIVIADRPEVTPAEVEALAGKPVVLCDEYTHTPAVREFGRLAAEVKDGVEWVELLLRCGDDARDDLWRALVTLTACGLPIDTVPLVTPSHCLIADCCSGRARVHITAVRESSPAGCRAATIKAFGPFGSLELRLGDPDVANPGEVIRTDDDRACLAKPEFQTSRRAALKEAHAALADGLAITSRLDDYALASRLLEQATRAA